MSKHRVRLVELDDQGNKVLLANDADVAELMKLFPEGKKRAPRLQGRKASRRRHPDRRARA